MGVEELLGGGALVRDGIVLWGTGNDRTVRFWDSEGREGQSFDYGNDPKIKETWECWVFLEQPCMRRTHTPLHRKCPAHTTQFSSNCSSKP
eukprot:4395748-Amphidinium_carterae.1